MNRNELRRLEKAAREKDKRKLAEWASQYESQIQSELIKRYEKYFSDSLQNSIDCLIIAAWYTLHFSEETNLQKADIASFVEDLLVTLDMYRTGEYNTQDYKDQLEKDGIIPDRYDHDRIYKEFLNTHDTELVSFIRGNHRNIITVLGDIKYRDIIFNEYKRLTLDGNMVFLDAFVADNETDEYDIETNNSIVNEKILLSNSIFVINKDNYIDDITKKRIEYAKEHNKEILYYESNEIGE